MDKVGCGRVVYGLVRSGFVGIRSGAVWYGVEGSGMVRYGEVWLLKKQEVK